MAREWAGGLAAPAVGQLRPHVGLILAQHAHAVAAAQPRGGHERCEAGVIGQVDVGLVLEQQLRRRCVARHSGREQQRLAWLGLGLGLGLGVGVGVGVGSGSGLGLGLGLGCEQQRLASLRLLAVELLEIRQQLLEELEAIGVVERGQLCRLSVDAPFAPPIRPPPLPTSHCLLVAVERRILHRIRGRGGHLLLRFADEWSAQEGQP